MDQPFKSAAFNYLFSCDIHWWWSYVVDVVVVVVYRFKNSKKRLLSITEKGIICVCVTTRLTHG